MELEAIIAKVIDGKGFYSFTPFSETYLLGKRQITEGRLLLDDGRTISAQQRKYIYATVRDIASETGYMPEEAKEWLKYTYIERYGSEYFSLSDCNMTTARNFLQFLIDFCIEESIPTAQSLLERAPDIGRMIYHCLLHRKCCITQFEGAQVHHINAVGMGSNRNKIIHVGMEVIPLLPGYHIEIHNIGNKAFFEKYKVFGIKLDETLCNALGLNTEAS